MPRQKYVYKFPTPIHEQIYLNCVDLKLKNIRTHTGILVNQLRDAQRDLGQLKRNINIHKNFTPNFESEGKLLEAIAILEEFPQGYDYLRETSANKLNQKQYDYFSRIFNHVSRNITRHLDNKQGLYCPINLERKLQLFSNWFLDMKQNISNPILKSKEGIEAIQLELNLKIKQEFSDGGEKALPDHVTNFVKRSNENLGEVKKMESQLKTDVDKLNHFRLELYVESLKVGKCAYTIKDEWTNAMLKAIFHGFCNFNIRIPKTRQTLIET